MRRFRFSLLALACAALVVAACYRSEVDGSRTFIITSVEQENQLGAEAYADILRKERRSDDAEATALLNRVGARLAAVAPARGFAYEFALIESREINAFCLPGGKVAFYTGILGMCRTEAGVAAVMGHEIAHAIERHGGRRMTQGILVEAGGLTLAALLESRGVSPTWQTVSMAAFGLGSQVGVLLPYSRQHELDADALGLRYMALAGYEPEEAVAFWQRFAAMGSQVPQFLSTHPASDERAARMHAQMAQAKALYAQAPVRHGHGASVPARYLAR